MVPLREKRKKDARGVSALRDSMAFLGEFVWKEERGEVETYQERFPLEDERVGFGIRLVQE